MPSFRFLPCQYGLLWSTTVPVLPLSFTVLTVSFPYGRIRFRNRTGSPTHSSPLGSHEDPRVDKNPGVPVWTVPSRPPFLPEYPQCPEILSLDPLGPPVGKIVVRLPWTPSLSPGRVSGGLRRVPASLWMRVSKESTSITLIEGHGTCQGPPLKRVYPWNHV